MVPRMPMSYRVVVVPTVWWPSINPSAKNNTGTTKPSNYIVGDRTYASKGDLGEIPQRRSVRGRCVWFVQLCKPEKLYICSRLWQVVNTTQLTRLVIVSRVLLVCSPLCGGNGTYGVGLMLCLFYCSTDRVGQAGEPQPCLS